MQAIAIVDNNWAVSLKKKSFASIPRERKSMMKEIEGKTIIYDYEYIQELPGQQPVSGCRNLAFTGDKNVTVKGAECFKTLQEIETALAGENTEKVYIIHGAPIYTYFFDSINVFHITKIDYEYNADEYIENLDKNNAFHITADSDEQYCYDIIYSFLRYERS